MGTAQVETAIRAVEAAGFSHRVDFYYVLRSTLIARTDDLETYHQVFSMFWRDPEFLETMLHLMSPQLRDDKPPPPKAAAHRRAADAMADQPERASPPKIREDIVQDAVLTWSDAEILKRMDFEQMSSAELAAAERAVRTLKLPVAPLITRRFQPTQSGPRTDGRATIRAALRRYGEIERIARRRPRKRPPDLVALCDISGSMSSYSRMLLRFLHAVAHAPVRSWGQVSAFTFGTRLTNVTRPLRRSDPDAALAAIGHEARDWEGGTRIGCAVERFNKDWSRRVLGSGAVVLLITDGLERDGVDVLDRELRRLSLSSRHLAWLNPLLRFDDFAPRAAGIRTMLPIVDSFHACHSLGSLADLSEALGQTDLRDRFVAQL